MFLSLREEILVVETAGGEGVSGLAPGVLGTQGLSLYSALLSSQATCVASHGDKCFTDPRFRGLPWIIKGLATQKLKSES